MLIFSTVLALGLGAWFRRNAWAGADALLWLGGGLAVLLAGRLLLRAVQPRRSQPMD